MRHLSLEGMILFPEEGGGTFQHEVGASSDTLHETVQTVQFLLQSGVLLLCLVQLQSYIVQLLRYHCGDMNINQSIFHYYVKQYAKKLEKY